MKPLILPILLYHRIGHGKDATPPHLFRQHMRHLVDRGISGVPLSDFELLAAGRGDQERPSVMISFDDGSQDCLTEALPVLAEFDLHATVFLITGRMRGCNEGRTPYGNALSWNEARELQASGRIALQSHSHTHSAWPFSMAGQLLLAGELRQSRARLIAELGGDDRTFCHLAWPWGRCSTGFESLAKEIGYTHQYLVQRGALTAPGRTLRLPRLCCDGMSTARFSRWIEILSSPILARSANGLYGGIRHLRRGLAYQ